MELRLPVFSGNHHLSLRLEGSWVAVKKCSLSSIIRNLSDVP